MPVSIITEGLIREPSPPVVAALTPVPVPSPFLPASILYVNHTKQAIARLCEQFKNVGADAHL